MNQEKIGKFIASVRKRKNMTQKELANKLNVTDRAISNWENGKNMPDLSMFKPICDCLEITINDLLSGENIDAKSYRNKFEENVTNMMLYSRKKFLKKFFIVILIIILLSTITCSIFLINNNTIDKEYNNTYDYNTKMIESTIKKYIVQSMPNNFTRYDGKNFELSNVVQTYIFKINEVSNEEINVYLWAMAGAHYKDEINGEKYIMYKDKTSKPYKFTLKRNEDKISYSVISMNSANITEEINCRKSNIFIEQYFPKEIQNTAKNFYNSKEEFRLFEKYWDIVENIYLYY